AARCAPGDRHPTGARARARLRHAQAVRRARDAGRADRGDRQGGRHRARADLPPVRVEGRAVRADGDRLPRRARGRARRGDRRPRPEAAARAVRDGLRRVLRALPGLPRLLAVAHAAPRARAARDPLGVGLVPSRAGDGRVHRPGHADPPRPRLRPARVHGERPVDADARRDAPGPARHRAATGGAGHPRDVPGRLRAARADLRRERGRHRRRL
ncbi:MAG: hypothetical protein AVDCRST_MAG85-1532, partial [uncultured Solirubrobacteraceae bacterium]